MEGMIGEIGAEGLAARSLSVALELGVCEGFVFAPLLARWLGKGWGEVSRRGTTNALARWLGGGGKM